MDRGHTQRRLSPTLFTLFLSLCKLTLFLSPYCYCAVTNSHRVRTNGTKRHTAKVLPTGQKHTIQWLSTVSSTGSSERERRAFRWWQSSYRSHPLTHCRDPCLWLFVLFFSISLQRGCSGGKTFYSIIFSEAMSQLFFFCLALTIW